jgi:hypothetical protein
MSVLLYTFAKYSNSFTTRSLSRDSYLVVKLLLYLAYVYQGGTVVLNKKLPVDESSEKVKI